MGDFPLEEIKNLKVANHADPTKPGQVFEGPEIVEGRVGKGIDAQRREQRHASPGEL